MANSITKHRITAFKYQNGRCHYCGLPMWLKQPTELTAKYKISKGEASRLRCTAEHLLARRDGGSDTDGTVSVVGAPPYGYPGFDVPWSETNAPINNVATRQSGYHTRLGLWVDGGDNTRLVYNFDVQYARFSAVPIPPALWLFCSGLLGLFRFSRRNKTA
jgi:hypothetical protein